METSLNTEIIKYENLVKNMTYFLPKEITWKEYNRLWGDSVHRICSYVAMFSPSLANYFIEQYSNKNDIVLDTFSGRGTTVLESRLLERKTYGIDLNPFAYVLSKAKSKSFKLEDVLNRIRYWEEKYKKSKKNFLKDIHPNLKIYYSDKNLKQLSFIKENLGLNYQTLLPLDNFILAITLGLMHGPMRKNGETIYFSLGMSNHTSMAPNYVKNYALKHNLKKSEDNIFDKIYNRSIHVLKKAKFSDNDAEIKIGNALDISRYFTITPKLIFTSPPYLNLINYTKQNWIKMWMLGFNNDEENKKIGLDDKHNFNNYELFMEKYLLEISKISNIETSIILVIGDANNKRINYNSEYFESMWERLKYKVPLVLTEIYTDRINQKKKATSSLGTKSGRATRLDKIYVFKLK